jgi:hypothetical protein
MLSTIIMALLKGTEKPNLGTQRWGRYALKDNPLSASNAPVNP